MDDSVMPDAAGEENARRLAALRHDIDIAIAELDRGEGIEGEEAFRSVLESLERD